MFDHTEPKSSSDMEKDKVSTATASDIQVGDKVFVRLHWTRIQVDIVIIR